MWIVKMGVIFMLKRIFNYLAILLLLLLSACSQDAKSSEENLGNQENNQDVTENTEENVENENNEENVEEKDEGNENHNEINVDENDETNENEQEKEDISWKFQRTYVDVTDEYKDVLLKLLKEDIETVQEEVKKESNLREIILLEDTIKVFKSLNTLYFYYQTDFIFEDWGKISPQLYSVYYVLETEDGLIPKRSEAVAPGGAPHPDTLKIVNE